MADIHYMTQEGLDKLKKDLADALARRPVISAAIAEAREKGDLSENAEYDAARDAQALLEIKIAKLKDMVANAKVIDESQVNTDTVQMLTRVKFQNLANKMTMLAQRIEPGTAIHITEAKNESFISITEGHNVRRVQETLFDVYEMKPHIILETSSIEVGKRLVNSMESVFICPDVYLDPYFLSQDRCVLYPLLGVANKRYCYVCSRRDAYLSPYARAFIELIKTRGVKERIQDDYEKK